MTTRLDELPVVVIGAGPVGLAAAAHLAERGLPFTVLEAGDGPAAAVRQWGHVRLFSPWRFNIDAAARRLLADAGWVEPDADVLPTGGQLAADYLQPLADLPALKPHVRYGARVAAVTRLGLDRLRTAGREDTPFLVRLADGDDVLARAVIDASGTWGTPNVLGASGIPAHGETPRPPYRRARPARRPRRGPGPVRRQAHPRRRRRPLGRQHAARRWPSSPAQAPGTSVVWAIRAASPARTYGGEAADALPARGALGTRLRAHVEAGTIELVTGFSRAGDHRPHRTGGWRVSDGAATVTADRIVSATGFRPDHTHRRPSCAWTSTRSSAPPGRWRR